MAITTHHIQLYILSKTAFPILGTNHLQSEESDSVSYKSTTGTGTIVRSKSGPITHTKASIFQYFHESYSVLITERVGRPLLLLDPVCASPSHHEQPP